MSKSTILLILLILIASVINERVEAKAEQQHFLQQSQHRYSYVWIV